LKEPVEEPSGDLKKLVEVPSGGLKKPVEALSVGTTVLDANSLEGLISTDAVLGRVLCPLGRLPAMNESALKADNERAPNVVLFSHRGEDRRRFNHDDHFASAFLYFTLVDDSSTWGLDCKTLPSILKNSEMGNVALLSELSISKCEAITLFSTCLSTPMGPPTDCVVNLLTQDDLLVAKSEDIAITSLTFLPSVSDGRLVWIVAAVSEVGRLT